MIRRQLKPALMADQRFEAESAKPVTHPCWSRIHLLWAHVGMYFQQ